MAQRRAQPAIEPLRSGLLACLAILLAACPQGDAPTETGQVPSRQNAAEQIGADPWFADVTTAAGIDFTHRHGGSGRRYLVETMGSGGGVLDLDGDGWMDIVLWQGQPLPGHDEAVSENAVTTAWSHGLYRNRRDGSFENLTEGSGLDQVGYAMGSCAGDVDNDGMTDLYVTAYGPDQLLRNLGDGRFEPITGSAGIDNPGWGASCAMADYNRDGCLDIFVTNYVDARFDNHIRCGPADHSQYCHPDVYDGVADQLYRNRCDGSGRFDELGAQAGVRIDDPAEAKGLGVVWLDYDDDGWQDVYVANDSTRNFLFHNQGDGTFREVGIYAGAAYNAGGKTEAGMGVAVGDLAARGRPDLVVTHLDFETNTYYRNLGDGLFEDGTMASGLGPPSKMNVGFGIVSLDADNDGRLDLYVANGHIIDNISRSNPSLSHAQPDQLLLNRGRGRFAPLPASEAVTGLIGHWSAARPQVPTSTTMGPWICW